MFAASPAFRRHTGITAFELQLPDDLTALSDEDLSGLLAQATDEFDGIMDDAGDAPTPEQLAQAQTLRDQILAVRGESERRTNEASERANEVAALRDAVHGPASTDEPDAAADAPAAVEAPAEEAQAVAASTSAPAAPAAPAGRPSLSAARTAAPSTPTAPRTPTAPARGQLTLLASSGAANYSGGQSIEWNDAARIFGQRAQGVRGAAGRHTFHIASARIPYPENLVASTGPEGALADEILAAAADESRLPGGSLTAAGTGWCAPSDVLYDVVDDGATEDGLISVAEIGVSHGGIRFTHGVDFASVYADGFYQTEADNIAGTAKTFVSIPCPAFVEERLDAIGVGVKSGILQRVGFPETISQFMKQTMLGHAHRVSAKTIAKMVAGSTAVGTVGNAQAASTTLLEVLELQIIDLRQRNMLSDSQTFEVVLPSWIKGIIRADYAKRNSVDSPFNVTDAMINEWFTIRGAVVQFTKDWQTKLEGGIAIGDVAAAAVAYPTHVDALIYKAGTFVRGLEDVITINGLYDSALLAQNEELALFTEQGLLVAKRGFVSRKITVEVTIDGQSGVQGAYTAGV